MQGTISPLERLPDVLWQAAISQRTGTWPAECRLVFGTTVKERLFGAFVVDESCYKVGPFLALVRYAVIADLGWASAIGNVVSPVL